MMFQSYALFPHLQRARQRRLQPEDARRRARPSATRRATELLELRRDGRAMPSALPAAALGRPAAARGAGPRADHRAAGAAARRAALGARPVPAHPMRAELKRLQTELGITFVHVTHSQDEAMALADLVVVMNARPDRAAGHAARGVQRAAHRVRRPLHRRPQRHRRRRRRPGRGAHRPDAAQPRAAPAGADGARRRPCARVEYQGTHVQVTPAPATAVAELTRRCCPRRRFDAAPLAARRQRLGALGRRRRPPARRLTA